MKNKQRGLERVLLASAVVLGCQAAHAQSRAYDPSQSWLPYTTRGYVGISGGKADYDVPCTAGFSCDDSNEAFKIYTGGMLNQNFGLELAYLQGGEADRAGGNVKARGVNISLVGLLPFNETFEAFGKVGGTYGWTKTSASALSGVETGKEEGGGVSYGVGLNVFFTPNWGAVVEWERHRFHFASGKEDVDLATVGLKYRF